MFGLGGSHALCPTSIVVCCQLVLCKNRDIPTSTALRADCNAVIAPTQVA